MQTVSTAWAKATQQTLLPEMLVELTYGVTDPGIHEDAVVTAQMANSASKIGTLLSDPNTSVTKYGALGWNSWGLDGTFEYYDPSYRGDCFMGGYYGLYNNTGWATGYEPQIIISFPELREVTLPGLQITWCSDYNEWASSFKVTVHRGTTVVAERTIEGNTSIVSEVDLPMSEYNKIVITVLKWSLPHGMARCTSVYLGAVSVFAKEDLLSFNHSQEVDLLSASLPTYSMTFSLRNENAQWNPDNESGNAQFLSEQQEIKLRYAMKHSPTPEWIDGGVFWLSEWDIPNNGMEARFTAKGVLGFMNETYSGPQSGTLYSIAEAALKQASLPALSNGYPNYELDPVLKNYSTSFDGEYTIAEMLQLVAHASTCVIHQDRKGVLHIQAWEPQYSNYVIDENISYTHPEYTISRPLKSVSVGYGADNARITLLHESKGEIQSIDNTLLVTEEDATRVGEKAIEILQHRKVISGEIRADVSLDCLDGVIVTSRYSSSIIALTGLEYSINGGGIRGKYTGRVVSPKLTDVSYHVGEIYSGEVS